MNDRQLDDLIRATNPVPDAAIDRVVRSVDVDDLSEEIMSSTTTHTTPSKVPVITTTDDSGSSVEGDRSARVELGDRRRPPSGRRRAMRVLALAAAAAAFVAAGVAISVRNDGGQAWAAELVAYAERSPLLLLDGAEVAYADQYGTEGEMRFDTDDGEASLHWRNGPLEDWLADRLAGGSDVGDHAVVGEDASIVRYDGTDEYTALWELEGRVIEFRASADDLGAFRSLLDDVVVTDVDGWLSAMPASVIENAAQPVAIDEMLAGVPLPPGFDRSTLPDTATITDRYQLGARVVGAVACDWIERWVAALDVGDAATAGAAVDALQTSPDWPVIQEMNRSGAYGQVLASYVDAMAAGGELAPGGATVQGTYRDALGC